MDWKELYYWAMVNASRKHAWKPNWALEGAEPMKSAENWGSTQKA